MIKKVCLWILVIMTMMGIFSLSSQDGSESSGLSRKVTVTVLSLSEDFTQQDPINQEILIEKYNGIFRELAHISIYLVLGFWVICLLGEYSIQHMFLVSFVWCFLFALVDEINQGTIVSGRSFQMIDLYKDWFGSVVGIGLGTTLSKLLNECLKKRG